jgi:hypothetical protein
MAYEIWDGASGNLLIVRSSQTEALAVVRDAMVSHGSEYVDDLALILEDDNGESHVIAEGNQLAKLASSENAESVIMSRSSRR